MTRDGVAMFTSSQFQKLTLKFLMVDLGKHCCEGGVWEAPESTQVRTGVQSGQLPVRTCADQRLASPEYIYGDDRL